MKHLHILNGDAIASAFSKQPLPITDIAVWREVLAEGPVIPALGSAAFWQKRSDFFQQHFGVSSEEYLKKALKEFQIIQRAYQYDAVTLWFEYDWFCQINMVGLLSFFHQQKEKLPPISIVCIGEMAGYSQLVGLGEIADDHFPKLFEERQLLPAKALHIASQFWDAYTAGRPEELLPIARSASTYFPYLAPATEAHLRLYPQMNNGLSALQETLLKAIDQHQFTKRQVIGFILRQESYLGFGDLQYFVYLDDLSSLITTAGDRLMLNAHGKAILAGETDFQTNGAPLYYYGGANTQEIRWQATNHQIIRL